MQNDSLLDNNRVYVSGRIVSLPKYSHEVYGEGFYSFKLEVSRLSDVSDILPVMVSERLVDVAEFAADTRLNIFGQVRSYNSYIEAERKNRLLLTIFARDVKLAQENDVLGSARKNPNDVFLNGYICKPPTHRLTPFGREITDMLVAVNRSYNKSDYIPCIAWGRNSRFASSLDVGANIKIYGRMQSREYQKKYEDGSVENKVAYEVSIAKIESGE